MILGKFNNIELIKIPENVRKFWSRKNFDKGEFLRLRNDKREAQADKEMQDEINDI